MITVLRVNCANNYTGAISLQCYEGVRRCHFRPFSNADNFRPEGDSDVIFGMVVDPTGVKVRVKAGDSRSSRSRDIRLPHFATCHDDEAGHHIRAVGVVYFTKFK